MAKRMIDLTGVSGPPFPKNARAIDLTASHDPSPTSQATSTKPDPKWKSWKDCEDDDDDDDDEPINLTSSQNPTAMSTRRVLLHPRRILLPCPCPPCQVTSTWQPRYNRGAVRRGEAKAERWTKGSRSEATATCCLPT